MRAARRGTSFDILMRVFHRSRGLGQDEVGAFILGPISQSSSSGRSSRSIRIPQDFLVNKRDYSPSLIPDERIFVSDPNSLLATNFTEKTPISLGIPLILPLVKFQLSP